jgi:hypothetical protein
MLAEVATRGTDRLQRKLPVDVHHFIPIHVRDREMREKMIEVARNLASWCGCELGLPDTAPVAPVTSPLDTSTWREWLGRLGFTSRRIKLEDEENRGGKNRG